MKITRQKKVHKYLNFFSNNYGFRKPYQILIDGPFCYAALQNKVNIRDQLTKYLESEVKLLTTQCVILEVESLGHDLYGTVVIVKQFALHKCGHEGKPIPAFQCLKEMIGVKNAHRYIIASQDHELRRYARSIPGVPVIYLHQQTPTIEQPSEPSVRMANLHSKERCVLNNFEEKALVSSKQKLGIKEEEVQQRKKRKKGKNPLSCKPKKKKPQSLQPESSGKHRKRKRVKIAGHVKEAMRSSVI